MRPAGNAALTPGFVEFVFGGANSVPQSHFADEGGQSDKKNKINESESQLACRQLCVTQETYGKRTLPRWDRLEVTPPGMEW